MYNSIPFHEYRTFSPLGLVYYLLGNLHPKFRSSLKSIQLLCVARNDIIVKYGIDEILKPVTESIQELEMVMLLLVCMQLLKYI